MRRFRSAVRPAADEPPGAPPACRQYGDRVLPSAWESQFCNYTCDILARRVARRAFRGSESGPGKMTDGGSTLSNVESVTSTGSREGGYPQISALGRVGRFEADAVFAPEIALELVRH